MKITVGRLKTIIQEELDSFNKLEEMCPPEGAEDIGDDITVTSAEQTELILDDLRDILEEWEETEYESDEQRWQAYAQDIQDLVDKYDDDPDDDFDDDFDDDEEELEEMIKKQILDFLKEEK